MGFTWFDRLDCCRCFWLASVDSWFLKMLDCARGSSFPSFYYEMEPWRSGLKLNFYLYSTPKKWKRHLLEHQSNF
jgi:hypothetical protein